MGIHCWGGNPSLPHYLKTAVRLIDTWLLKSSVESLQWTQSSRSLRLSGSLLGSLQPMNQPSKGSVSCLKHLKLSHQQTPNLLLVLCKEVWTDFPSRALQQCVRCLVSTYSPAFVFLIALSPSSRDEMGSHCGFAFSYSQLF